MITRHLESWGGIRRALLGLSALFWLALVVELWSEEHYGDLLQLAPMLFSTANLLLVLFHWRSTTTSGRQLLGWSLLISAGVGLFGLYEHLAKNLALELEMRPGKGIGDVLGYALRGPYPLLAPGSLCFGAAFTWLAARGGNPTAKTP